MQFLYENYDNAASVFIILTVILAGGAAWMSGRAIAITWKPLWQLVGYILILGTAARFFHYALFSGELLSIYYYLVQTIILQSIALLSYRLTRVKQMVTQYRWLYKRSGLLFWSEREKQINS